MLYFKVDQVVKLLCVIIQSWKWFVSKIFTLGESILGFFAGLFDGDVIMSGNSNLKDLSMMVNISLCLSFRDPSTSLPFSFMGLTLLKLFMITWKYKNMNYFHNCNFKIISSFKIKLIHWYMYLTIYIIYNKFDKHKIRNLNVWHCVQE